MSFRPGITDPSSPYWNGGFTSPADNALAQFEQLLAGWTGLYNDGNVTQEQLQDGVSDSIVGGLFGDVLGDATGNIVPEPDPSPNAPSPQPTTQPADISDILGDIQIQYPNFELPDMGGGGGQTAQAGQDEAQDAVPEPPSDQQANNQGGDPSAGAPPSAVYVPEEGVYVEPNHAPRDDMVWVHQNPDGTWVAGNEMGEVWETAPPGDEDLLADSTTGLEAEDITDIVYQGPNGTNTGGSVTINSPVPQTGQGSGQTGGQTGGQGTTTGGSGSGGTTVGSSGGQPSTGNQNTGGTGGGTGTGNGTGDGAGDGSGDGDGDGDGDGSGSNPFTPAGSLVAGAGGSTNELYPYSQIAPSQAASLQGLIDYVAALRSGR